MGEVFEKTDVSRCDRRKGRVVKRTLVAFVLLLAATSAWSGQATHAARRPAPLPLVAEADRLAAGEFPAEGPGGALIVVKDGKTLLRKGYGLADVEMNVPVRPEMIFRLGSVTKQFTAALVMMLAEEGRIALDDDITKYLADYPTQGKRITIEHLLTHTSGIKDYTRIPALMADANTDKPVAAVVDMFKSLPLDFDPGQQMRYTNSGYFLLGAILEKITGKPYADLVRERIFQPAGMTHSSYIESTRVLAGRAHGYQEVKGALVNARYYSDALPYSAGGVMSSVDDLAAWDAALSGDRLLKRESRERMLSSAKLSNGRQTGYGYGWYTIEFEGLRMQEHGGVIFGFIAYVLRIPEQHLYVALLTNRQVGKAEPFLFARKIAMAALGRRFADPKPAAVAAAAVDACLGYYESADDNAPVEFSKAGKRITMKRGRGEPVEIVASSPTAFYQKGTYLRIAFDKDAAGIVQGATIIDWGNTMKVRRAVKPAK